jgi:hypothetical protein
VQLIASATTCVCVLVGAGGRGGGGAQRRHTWCDTQAAQTALGVHSSGRVARSRARTAMLLSLLMIFFSSLLTSAKSPLARRGYAARSLSTVSAAWACITPHAPQSAARTQHSA